MGFFTPKAKPLMLVASVVFVFTPLIENGVNHMEEFSKIIGFCLKELSDMKALAIYSDIADYYYLLLHMESSLKSLIIKLQLYLKNKELPKWQRPR